LRRRKQRADIYLKHLEELSSDWDLDKDRLSDRETCIVGDNSFDWVHGHDETNYSLPEDDGMIHANCDSLDYQNDVHIVRSIH